MANPVVFRRNDSVGSADAESDDDFLRDCFVDSGQIEELLNCDTSKCIILGRTGAGKTALLKEIKARAEHVIEISPENLSLNFLTNSTVLSFFEAAGVHLDAFYKVLWQHLFCIELVKAKYEINNEQKQKDFFSSISGIFVKDKAKEAAFKYIEQWGQNFWQDTTVRVKEFTTKLESKLQADTSIGHGTIKLGASGASSLTEEQRLEVVKHGQDVVNHVHLSDLQTLIKSLNEDIFVDGAKPYYLVIDRLDENWVDDRIRFKLIRALIEAVRSFRHIRNIKVLVALRTDLLFTVLQRNAQAGFQTEKYESSYSKISWTRDLLVQVLDRRATSLFRRRYTKESVNIQDILPANQIDKRSGVDYLLDRTFFRPREAILFVNECIQRSEGRTRISVDLLRAAESSYSVKRLSSLQEEWAHEYPNLEKVAGILLKSRENAFSLGSISEDDVVMLAGELANTEPASKDTLVAAANRYINATSGDYRDLLYAATLVLYQVGVVGIKLAPHLALQWSYIDEPILRAAQLSAEAVLHVHKTFWIALNVTTKHRR